MEQYRGRRWPWYGAVLGLGLGLVLSVAGHIFIGQASMYSTEQGDRIMTTTLYWTLLGMPTNMLFLPLQGSDFWTRWSLSMIVPMIIQLTVIGIMGEYYWMRRKKT